MKNCPLKVRKQAWTYHHAGQCFSLVIDIIDGICPSKSAQSDGLNPLVVALHILYAQPFRQRTGFRLDECLVPDSLIDTHRAALTLRDKMYAHSDPGVQSVHSSDGESLLEMLLIVKNGTAHPASTVLTVRTPGLESLRGLSENLLESCRTCEAKLMNQYSPISKDGTYKINILGEDDAPLLAPYGRAP